MPRFSVYFPPQIAANGVQMKFFFFDLLDVSSRKLTCGFVHENAR